VAAPERPPHEASRPRPAGRVRRPAPPQPRPPAAAAGVRATVTSWAGFRASPCVQPPCQRQVSTVGRATSRSAGRALKHGLPAVLHREGGEAGAERARSSGSQLKLPSSHQVVVAHWRVMMSFVRVLSNSSSKALGCMRLRSSSFC
jgi:hypothetical protein